MKFAAVLLVVFCALQTSAGAQQTAERLPIVVPERFTTNALYGTCASRIENPGTMDGTLRVARCFLDNKDPRAARDLAIYLKNLHTTSDGRHFSLDSDAVNIIDELIATAGYLNSVGHQPEPPAIAPSPPANSKIARTVAQPVPKRTMHPTHIAASNSKPVSNADATDATDPGQRTSPIAGTPAGVEPVFVPRGTVVVVALDNAVTSYSAASREPLSYTVVQDVIVNGHVIARAGDEATGIVLEAQQGNEGGLYGIGWKAANLRVNVEKVNNFCGDSIATRFVRSEYRRRQGLFGSHQDLEIIKGQKYVAQTAHSQKICGEPTTALQSPVPADVLGPDN